MGFVGTTTAMLVVGIIAFGHAWIWAGMEEPAHRLTTRAVGMAMGYLVPVIPALNALYFHWDHFAQSPSAKLLVRLLQALHFIFK
jgi:hypothetical protein